MKKMSHDRSVFEQLIYTQKEKIKSFLDVDELHVGYHFTLRISPAWEKIFQKTIERARILGYGNELNPDIFKPKYEYIYIRGTKFNHLYNGGFKAYLNEKPSNIWRRNADYFYNPGHEVFDLKLHYSFGLAHEKKLFRMPGVELRNYVNLFGDSENDLALYLHQLSDNEADFSSKIMLSIGKVEHVNASNYRSDLSGPIFLEELLERVYLAAIDITHFQIKEQLEHDGKLFHEFKDLAPGYRVVIHGNYKRSGSCYIQTQGHPSTSWIHFEHENCQIMVRIHPIVF